VKTHPLPPEKSKEEQRLEQALRFLHKPKAESYVYSVSRVLMTVLWILTLNQVIQTVLMMRGK
jgi:hypothetical protein